MSIPTAANLSLIHISCYESSRLAVLLAKESGAHLHIAHVTTAKELEFYVNLLNQISQIDLGNEKK